MQVHEAQREVRRVYLGGLIGQAVSAILWLAAAAAGTWGGTRGAILSLVVGGFFIYPAVSLTLRLLGRPAALGAGNPFRWLAVQTAFVLPVSMPLVAPVVAYRTALFFPAMMVLLGAHYLPFATLYGMRSFLALAAFLAFAGVGIAVWLPQAPFSLGGWVAGAALLVFAGVGYAEQRYAER